MKDISKITINGKEHKVVLYTDKSLKNKAHLEGDKVILFTVNSNIPTLRSTLRAFLIEYAREKITERTEYFSEFYSMDFNKIAIKEQSSRWGSCSTRKNLNFNWRLILAPKNAMDYVVIHELCHTKEMNHSKKFWTLVEEIMPEYRVWQRWFRVNGVGLMRLSLLG